MTRSDDLLAGTPLQQRGLPLVLRRFLRTEAAGGGVLLAAAVVALVWANSPWDGSYTRLWATEVDFRIGTIGFTNDLRHLVNEGLMTLFFLVVGLEIKRELVAGELRSWRTAALPAVAAVGGMVVPAAIYVALTVGHSGARGWGIPMATDIAFAVGVVALLGRRVPSSLKLFLLTLAVVDDIGAIIVIAVFYSRGIDPWPLLLAGGLIGVMAGLRRLRVLSMPLHLLVGVGVWLATYKSGVHATLAGVALGLLTPARPLAPSALARKWTEDLSDEPPPEELRAMTRLANSSVSLAERLQYALHPLTSFVVIPLFALANAGVVLERSSLDTPGGTRVVLGIVLGLVVGKMVGVTGASWLAVRMGVSSLPGDVTWRQMLGIGAVAGVGFTVSLFVAGLAFTEPRLEAAAKIGIVAASVLASVLGLAALAATAPSQGVTGEGPSTGPENRGAGGSARTGSAGDGTPTSGAGRPNERGGSAGTGGG
jgi:NhaA family Na+:H+ antiporter